MLARMLSAASALVLGACSVIGVRSGTEEPRFETIGQQGAVEIRRYAPRLAAETTVAAATEEAARSEGFRRLAGFIFGANRGQAKIAMTAPVAQASERIAMTAPVVQEAAAQGWTIRFFMPARYTRATLPQPEDPRVTIIEVPGATMAVLRYSGAPGAGAAATQRAALLAALQDGPWRPVGAVEDWFYDPPWTLPPLRRNEAVVPVTPR
ncbi:SOUL family heme-binding protein [Dankookia rubra]|uniref:SOUL family heme-binding protein n=1 Tax=Dankookia rubra TaxID=1442381 RepID=UPI0014090A63|nr:heme-binding protein [Dankookia rubra]